MRKSSVENLALNKKCWLCEKPIVTVPTPQWDSNYKVYLSPVHVCSACFSKRINRTYDKVFRTCAQLIEDILGINNV